MVDGNIGSFLEGLGSKAQKIEIRHGAVDGLRARLKDLRVLALELLQELPCRQQEDAAVPGMFAGGDVFLGRSAIRLLLEADDLVHVAAVGGLAMMDIAVAGHRARGRDPEQHEGAVLCRMQARFHCRMECRHVVDTVIGRHQEDDAVRVAASSQDGGDRCCRSCIAAHRLQNDLALLAADFSELLRDDEAMLRIGNDHNRLEKRRIENPLGRLLQRLLSPRSGSSCFG
jgi:hypothetical protein